MVRAPPPGVFSRLANAERAPSAPGFFRANPFDLDAECTYDHVAKFPIKCKVGHSYAKINHYTQVVGDACSATDLSEANFTKAVSTKCVRLHPALLFVHARNCAAPPLGSCVPRTHLQTAGGAGFGTFLLALIISSAVLVGLFTGVMFASPRARAWTLGKLGTDGLFGRIGRLVTRCTCYRSGPSYHFRELETEREWHLHGLVLCPAARAPPAAHVRPRALCRRRSSHV